MRNEEPDVAASGWVYETTYMQNPVLWDTGFGVIKLLGITIVARGLDDLTERPHAKRSDD